MTGNRLTVLEPKRPVVGSLNLRLHWKLPQIRQKKKICVLQVSRPYLGFSPDPKHFIVDCEQIVVKFAEKWGKCIEKCNFYIKYFDKIKCYAYRPYLVFSELKPETHIFFIIFFFRPNLYVLTMLYKQN